MVEPIYSYRNYVWQPDILDWINAGRFTRAVFNRLAAYLVVPLYTHDHDEEGEHVHEVRTIMLYGTPVEHAMMRLLIARYWKAYR